MTNAAKIRNMTDEELVEIVTGCCFGCAMVNDSKSYVSCGDVEPKFGGCKQATLKWLKSQEGSELW